MAKLELLPRKQFIITFDNDKKVFGKFGTFALKRLCLKKNLTDEQLYSSFTTKLLEMLPEYLLCAAENYFRELRSKESFPYDELDACEWIDEMGGMNSEILIRLCNYAAESIRGEKKTETETA